MDTASFRFLLLITTLIPFQASSQKGGIPEYFVEIDTQPQVLDCRNELDVNNQEGHLQGIQLMVNEGIEYALLSGSSSTYAYYAVVKLDDFQEVLSVNKLMYKPFKHAGGIQIHRDLMVVGIEDNAARDKSKVCIYKIDNPEAPPVKPLALAERAGEPFRSTAGCTGITRIGDRCLVVVGDWDTKHLDFYLFGETSKHQQNDGFEKVYTMDMDKTDRSAWLDNKWLAYQNINLLKDADGKLYLFAFGMNDRHENIADLYLMKHSHLREFGLIKLLSKRFACKEGADFRSGAGISIKEDGKLRVICCAPHINGSLVLNIFE